MNAGKRLDDALITSLLAAESAAMKTPKDRPAAPPVFMSDIEALFESTEAELLEKCKYSLMIDRWGDKLQHRCNRDFNFVPGQGIYLVHGCDREHWKTVPGALRAEMVPLLQRAIPLFLEIKSKEEAKSARIAAQKIISEASSLGRPIIIDKPEPSNDSPLSEPLLEVTGEAIPAFSVSPGDGPIQDSQPVLAELVSDAGSAEGSSQNKETAISPGKGEGQKKSPSPKTKQKDPGRKN